MTSATTGSNGTTATGYGLHDDVENINNHNNNNDNNNNNNSIQVPTHAENDTTGTTTAASSTNLIPMSLQQPNDGLSNTCSSSSTEGNGNYKQRLQNLQQKICVCIRDVRTRTIYLNMFTTYGGVYYLCAYIQDNQVVYEQLSNNVMNESFNIFNLLMKNENVLYDWFIITIFVLYIGIIVIGGIYGVAYNCKYLVMMCFVLYCIETIISAVALQILGTIVNAALAYIHYDIHTEDCLRWISFTVGIHKFFGIIL